MPETPSREGDRCKQRFEVAWRQVDDQSPDLSFAHRGQFRSDDLEVPAQRKLGLRIEVVEAAQGEVEEILPQQRVVLGPGQLLDH